MRVDFNVPLKSDNTIGDTFRIDACLPTIRFLIKHRARLVLVSHMGRPDGYEKQLSLKPIASFLEGALNQKIIFYNTVDEAVKQSGSLKEGEVALVENIRFEAGEHQNNRDLAFQLSQMGDVFINEAFAVSHREHATIVGIPKFLPSFAGFLLAKEIQELDNIRNYRTENVVFLIGGSKVRSKIQVLGSLIDIINTICSGGIIANALLASNHYAIGHSVIEDKDDILQYLQKVQLPSSKVAFPRDVIVGKDIEGKKGVHRKNISAVGNGDIILDIGPDTVKLYAGYIRKADIVVWSGPMGKFEIDAFSNGTKGVIDALYNTNAKIIVGGGDAVTALDKYEARDVASHICTGGGAMLRYLATQKLAGIDALKV